ncbi:MAG: UDP-N-acetylmuramate--L-alanine ligase [Actinobacteria bacterium]|nr:UDP-N-acetylmuramate--L-alanine ligase [Actinomycetota bacterium]
MTFPEGGRIHFIGIGGVGMSAIAKVLRERGYEISGSDVRRSPPVVTLEAMGARIDIGHWAASVEGAALVVVSSAIKKNNPEVVHAGVLGVPVISRGEALAALLDEHGRSIVVAGTHGKTTTTSMIVTILRHAGMDPTYLVGGGLNDAGTNARYGKDAVVVAESDESDGSFLLLSPDVAVVTNVEPDHLDYWRSFEALLEGFETFLMRVREGGSIVLPSGATELTERALETGRNVLSFGDGGSMHVHDMKLDIEGADFMIVSDEQSEPVRLNVAGRHNVINALAAVAACTRIGMSLSRACTGLSQFKGVERRFQVRGSAAGVTVIDDYAHHPTEVRVNLEAARLGTWDRVIAVFQPHLYSRTAALAHEFGASFGDADRIIVTDVYGAREVPQPGVSGKLVADAVCARLPGRPVAYIPHRGELLSYLATSVRAGDLVLTLGAGDISAVGEELLERLGTK